MQFDLPDLPYSYRSLSPHISDKTLRAHHEGHLDSYIEKLNAIPEVKVSDEQPLEKFVIEALNMKKRVIPNQLPPVGQPQHMFDMAAQVYNHMFYFNSLTPDKTDPSGEILNGINRYFGNIDEFKKTLKSKAMQLFGAGWTWVVLANDKLAVVNTKDAYTPICYGMAPLLCIDMWEHAYYLDYKNEKGRYLDAVINHLMNWEFANKNLEHV